MNQISSFYFNKKMGNHFRGYIFKQIYSVVLMLLHVKRNVRISNAFVIFVDLACIFSTLMILVTINTRQATEIPQPSTYLCLLMQTLGIGHELPITLLSLYILYMLNPPSPTPFQNSDISICLASSAEIHPNEEPRITILHALPKLVYESCC